MISSAKAHLSESPGFGGAGTPRAALDGAMSLLADGTPPPAKDDKARDKHVGQKRYG
jgi:hypothetical protein